MYIRTHTHARVCVCVCVCVCVYACVRMCLCVLVVLCTPVLYLQPTDFDVLFSIFFIEKVIGVIRGRVVFILKPSHTFWSEYTNMPNKKNLGISDGTIILEYNSLGISDDTPVLEIKEKWLMAFVNSF